MLLMIRHQWVNVNTKKPLQWEHLHSLSWQYISIGLVQDCGISSALAMEIPLPYKDISFDFSYDLTILLNQWGLVTPYGDKDLGQHWLR